MQMLQKHVVKQAYLLVSSIKTLWSFFVDLKILCPYNSNNLFCKGEILMDNYKVLGLEEGSPMYMVDKMYKTLKRHYNLAKLDTSKIDNAYLSIKSSKRCDIDDYISNNNLLSLYDKYNLLYEKLYNTDYWNELDGYFISIAFHMKLSIKDIISIHPKEDVLSTHNKSVATILNYFIDNVYSCSKDLFIGITSTYEYKYLLNKLLNIKNEHELVDTLLNNIELIIKIFQIDNMLKIDNPLIIVNSNKLSLIKEASIYQKDILSNINNISITYLYILFGEGRYNYYLLKKLAKIDSSVNKYKEEDYNNLELTSTANLYNINDHFKKELEIANGLYKEGLIDSREVIKLVNSKNTLVDNYICSVLVNYAYDIDYIKDKFVEISDALEIEDNLHSIINMIGYKDILSTKISNLFKEYLHSILDFKNKVRNALDINTLVSLYNSLKMASNKYVAFFKEAFINVSRAYMVSELTYTKEFTDYYRLIDYSLNTSDLFNICLLNMDCLLNIIKTSNDIIGDIDLSNEEIMKYFNLYNLIYIYKREPSNIEDVKKNYCNITYIERFKLFLKNLGINYPDGRRLKHE